MLGVGQNINLTEERVGCSDILVARPGQDGAPTAPGNVREADMVATAVTAEKECYAKRSFRWQPGGEVVIQVGEVGRRDTEGKGVFFEYEKVGFQGVTNK